MDTVAQQTQPGSAPVGAELAAPRIDPPIYRRHPVVQVAAFAVLLALVGGQLVSSVSTMNSVNTWLLYIMAGLGFYIMFVVGGRFAFCQTFMMTTGGYTAAYFSKDHSFWFSMVVAVAVVAVVATVFALVCARTESFLFAVATLALGQIGIAVYTHWTDFTGVNGVSSGVPVPEIFGTSVSSEKQFFWLFLAGAVLCLLVTMFIERSPVGREATATKEMPEVGRSCGLPTLRLQAFLFVAGSLMGAVAGALAAYRQGSMTTGTFSIDLALGLFLIPILGGVSSPWGTVLGALLYVQLPIVLSGLDKLAPLAYGVALVLVLALLPQGVLGLLSSLLRKVVPDRFRPGSNRSVRELRRGGFHRVAR